MDERDIAEQLQYFQGIADKYGYQIVPASTVHLTFEEMIQPAKLGFTTIKTGLYGKAVNDDLVHLVKLQRLKGVSYSVWWGVSLSYVPHEWQMNLRWHRSLKASRFDLFVTPYDCYPALTADGCEAETLVAYVGFGELCFRETLQTMWRNLHQVIVTWFSTAQSLNDVSQIALEQANRNWIGPRHLPNPLMVYALTLGRMGRKEEALIALDKFFELNLEPPQAQQNLKKGLRVSDSDQPELDTPLSRPLTDA